MRRKKVEAREEEEEGLFADGDNTSLSFVVNASRLLFMS